MDTWERKSPSIYEPLPKSVAGEIQRLMVLTSPKPKLHRSLPKTKIPPLVPEKQSPAARYGKL